MTVRSLPEHPHLDQLKRQAKELLHAARNHDAAALDRFRVLPALASLSPAALTSRRLALHDAQSVIAREYGLPSWNELRDRVEELGLARAAVVVAFIEAATGERALRAWRLLAAHPELAHESLFAAIVLADAAHVLARLDAEPDLATRRGGPRDWQPLHYLCHSALLHDGADRAAGAVAIARRLIALGADPNLRFGWRHHGVFRPVLWAAVCQASSLPLAAALLEGGADPSDGVTLPLAVSGGNLAALDLLHAHGVDVDRPWATDGSAPIYAVLQWSRCTEGIEWLLAHGAAPDPVFVDNGESPLHVVAARWGAGLATSLLDHGASIDRRRADGRTPFAVASLSGNTEVARCLLDRGASPELSPVDRWVAACARGDRAQADASLRAQPELRDALGPEHHGVLLRAIERRDVGAVSTMLACGFDPNQPDDSIGKTALHVAAACGWPEGVRLVLAAGASVHARDREFDGTPLVWAAEHSRHGGDAAEFDAVARLLLDAGSPTDWRGNDEPSEALIEILAAWRGNDDGA